MNLAKTRQLTWIELLPRDAKWLIREHMARSAYSTEVLPELIMKGKRYRTYIDDCEAIECREFQAPGITHRHQRRQQFNGIIQVLAWRNHLRDLEIGDNDHHDNVIIKSYHNDYESEDSVKFYIRRGKDWKCAFTQVYHEIFAELAVRIEELHNIIRNIRSEYDYRYRRPNTTFAHVGVPPWESSTYGQMTFRSYINDYSIVGRHRNLLTQFVNQIIYNCGHLPSVYERVCAVREQICTIDV